MRAALLPWLGHGQGAPCSMVLLHSLRVAFFAVWLERHQSLFFSICRTLNSVVSGGSRESCQLFSALCVHLEHLLGAAVARTMRDVSDVGGSEVEG